AFFNNTADEDVWSESPKLVSFTDEADQQKLEVLKNWIRNHPSSEPLNEEVYYTSRVRLTEPKIHPHSFEILQKGVLTDRPNYLNMEDGGLARLEKVVLKGEVQMLVRFHTHKSTGSVEIRLVQPDGEL